MTTYNAPEAWEVRPPSGWRYGFPKVITQQYMDRFRYYHEPDAAIRSFLREHKYPNRWRGNTTRILSAPTAAFPCRLSARGRYAG